MNAKTCLCERCYNQILLIDLDYPRLFLCPFCGEANNVNIDECSDILEFSGIVHNMSSSMTVSTCEEYKKED